MYKFNPPSAKCTVNPILTKEEYYAPKIIINYDVMLKMKAFIESTEKEIAWLGTVKRNNNIFTVTEVYLIKQSTTAVTAELAEEGLQDFAERLIADGKEDELNNIRLWGHSHVNMEVNPSGTDDETFREYYKKCQYFIRLIGNKKGAMRIDIALPELNIAFDNVQYEIGYPEELQQYGAKIESLKTQINTLQNEIEENEKALSDATDGFYKAELDNAKSFVKTYIEKPVTYNYGYGSPFKKNTYEPNSYYYPSKTEKEEKEKEKQIIFMGYSSGYGTVETKWEPISKVFLPKQIEEIAECTSAEEVKNYVKLIKSAYEFPYAIYDENDWFDLMYAAEDYVKEQTFEDTAYDEYSDYGYDYLNYYNTYM